MNIYEQGKQPTTPTPSIPQTEQQKKAFQTRSDTVSIRLKILSSRIVVITPCGAAVIITEPIHDSRFDISEYKGAYIEKR